MDKLSRAARRITDALGSPVAILASLLLMLAWGVWACRVHFSDSSQIVLNTLTSIPCFILAFLILHGQNRDSRALHMKLDELLRADEVADNHYRHIEAASDKALAKLQDKALADFQQEEKE